MSDSPYKETRTALAWELIVEGCTAGDFDLLEIMVLREEHPGLAREADIYVDTLRGEFNHANLASAIEIAERHYRKALRDERRGKSAADDGFGNQVVAAIAERLAGRAPIAAWGITRLMRASLLKRTTPMRVARVGEIYRQLMQTHDHASVRNLARLGKRKALQGQRDAAPIRGGIN